jgi:hypothetical protein
VCRVGLSACYITETTERISIEFFVGAQHQHLYGEFKFGPRWCGKTVLYMELKTILIGLFKVGSVYEKKVRSMHSVHNQGTRLYLKIIPV